MAKDDKNIRIGAEAHRWIARVCGLTRESKSEFATRVLLAAARAEWKRLAPEVDAEERGGEGPPPPRPRPRKK